MSVQKTVKFVPFDATLFKSQEIYLFLFLPTDKLDSLIDRHRSLKRKITERQKYGRISQKAKAAAAKPEN